MAEKGDSGQVWLVIGALWIGLTGLCTINVSRGDSLGYQMAMVFGGPIVAIGLIPLIVGLVKRSRSKSR